MNRRKLKKIPKHTDLALRITVLVAGLLLVALIVLKMKGLHSMPPPACPIDGIAAEWRTDHRDGNGCNYGHYSKVEQKPHTWWAACQ